MRVYICSRFRNQDVVGKEVTRLIHSDPVSFIDIPDAAQVCSYVKYYVVCMNS